MDKMFSSIVPVFNSEKYVVECINSILFIPFSKEIILINDGSTDSSDYICKQIVRNNSCIKYFSKENGGAGSARNCGINHAEGEYIVFVDSDDTLDPKWYDIIKNIYREDFDLFVYGMAFDYYESVKLVKTNLLSNQFSGIKTKQNIIQNFTEYFDNNTLSSACNKVFKKKIIDKNNIRFKENMNHYEDLDFVMQYLSNIDTVYFFPDVLYHYRLNADDNHYLKRVSDLSIIQNNLDNLSVSINHFSWSNTVHSVVSNLYMNILMSHLMEKRVQMKEMSTNVETYIMNRNIVRMELKKSNQDLYDMIKNKEYTKLYFLINWKKAKREIKSNIKKILGI